MSALSSQVRTIVLGLVFLALFPLVFLATFLEVMPEAARQALFERVVLSGTFASLMALGLAAVYGIRMLY